MPARKSRLAVAKRLRIRGPAFYTAGFKTTELIGSIHDDVDQAAYRLVAGQTAYGIVEVVGGVWLRVYVDVVAFVGRQLGNGNLKSGFLCHHGLKRRCQFFSHCWSWIYLSGSSSS